LHKDHHGFPKQIFHTGFEDMLSDLLFAVYSIFRVFGYKKYNSGELLQHTHPPEPIRQRLVFMVLNSLMKSRLGDKIDQMITNTITNAENAFSCISESMITPDAINNAYSSDQEDHLHLIIKNWNYLRPQLEPYTYNELPPLQTNL
jgi:hypothetical protein